MSFETTHYENPVYASKAKVYGVIGIAIVLVYLISDIAYQIKKTFFKNKD